MYQCIDCSYQSAAKLWKCPNCDAFWTMHIISSNKTASKKNNTLQQSYKKNYQGYTLRTIIDQEYKRIFDDGLHSAGVYLIAGEPGIGKSTLVLQLLDQISDTHISYFSWEEQEEHIQKRKERVVSSSQKSRHIEHNNILEDILLSNDAPILVIDSIQTILSNQIESQSGSQQQVRYCADMLVQYAKKSNTTVIIIGHVTKSGEIAWPKYLEHIVDMVCYLEWDSHGEYRFLRTKKNRFGSTEETAIFQMTKTWLISSDYTIDQNHHHDGVIYTIAYDNGRAVLIPIELLITKMKGKYPNRTCVWLSSKRVEMLIAIIEKYGRINLSFHDIYINIPWEILFQDSWIDLAIALWLYFQSKWLSLSNIIATGELWLWWQIIKPTGSSKRNFIHIPKNYYHYYWDNSKKIQDIITKIS